ncbi:MAG: tetratricopeptide repeat protein [Bradymonadia bacterium]
MRTYLFILLMLTCIGFAHAQPGDNATAFDTQVGAATMDFKAGRFDIALTAFRTLRSRSKDKSTRIRLQWNIARCLEELARPAEALAIFEDYSREVNDPVRKSRAQAKIDLLLPKVYGRVSVLCTGAQSALVSIEGSQLKQPCPAVFERIKPGLVVVIGEEGEKVRQMVSVEAGKTSEAKLTFVTQSPPVTPPARAESAAKWPWYVAGTAAVLTTSALTIWLVNRDDPKPTHRGTVCFDSSCD